MKPARFQMVALAGLLAAGWPALAPRCAAQEPSPAAVSGFDSYVAMVEARLARQHQSESDFIAGLADAQTAARLKQGELIVEKLTPAAGAALPGATIYDWRGTAFVPGATAANFERLMRGFSAYPRVYAPQVVSARVLAQQDDRYQVLIRVRQKHVITVVLDTRYDVTFSRPAAGRGFSFSRSTQVQEIEAAGTAHERALSPAEEHGFLWRLNTWWSWEERDGGLYIQIESVSLTRSIPTGLGWAIGPFVESVPRESLEFTLAATRDALRSRIDKGGSDAP